MIFVHSSLDFVAKRNHALNLILSVFTQRIDLTMLTLSYVFQFQPDLFIMVTLVRPLSVCYWSFHMLFFAKNKTSLGFVLMVITKTRKQRQRQRQSHRGQQYKFFSAFQGPALVGTLKLKIKKQKNVESAQGYIVLSKFIFLNDTSK